MTTNTTNELLRLLVTHPVDTYQTRIMFGMIAWEHADTILRALSVLVAVEEDRKHPFADRYSAAGIERRAAEILEAAREK
jgi:hypothetical protein